MYEPDMEAISLVVDRGTYCYKAMPFGLKNAGVMYQQLVNRIFKEKIEDTMKVYNNDMVVKRK